MDARQVQYRSPRLAGSTNFSAQQELSVGAVEDIEEPVAIGVQQEFAGFSSILRVDQHRRLGRIPVVDIVRRELIVPFQLSGIGIQSQNAIGEEIIAGTVAVVRVRKRIARGPEQRVRIRIVGTRQPGRAATEERLLPFPGFGSRFTFARGWSRSATNVLQLRPCKRRGIHEYPSRRRQPRQ